MTRRLAIALMVLVGLIVVPSTSVHAHEGHPHKVMGTVTMAAADHLMLKTTDGKDATIQITAKTKITKAKKSMTVADLSPGTRVVVTAVTLKKVTTARSIEIGTAATTK